MTLARLRNIGPKSAAWLRQVGVRSAQDLVELGAVNAFIKVRRAGFKPSLNLLYALEGALIDCHWQALSEAQRDALQRALDAATAQLPAPRGHVASAPVSVWQRAHDPDEDRAHEGLSDDDRD